jgi:lipid A 3-O-deacylase
MFQRIFAALFLGAALSAASLANATDEGTQTTNAVSALRSGAASIFFDVDNDSFIAGDRYYTNGIRLGWRSDRVKTGSGEWTRYSLALANNMYTGADISTEASEIPPNDRPYAGWTHVDLIREVLREDDSGERWDFTIGCIGPCSGSESLQKWWHDDVVSAPEPKGWDAQIGNEVALQTFYRKRFRTRFVCPNGSCGSGSVRSFDLSPHVTAALGNIFLNAGAGVTARVNLYRMKGYSAGLGVGEPIPKRSLSAVSTATASDASDMGDTELFVFARVDARLVAYNATIEGRMFGGPDPFAERSSRSVVDLEAGVALAWRRVSLVVSYATRSTEVEGQPSELARHRWLGFRVGYAPN